MNMLRSDRKENSSGYYHPIILFCKQFTLKVWFCLVRFLSPENLQTCFNYM